MSIAYHSVPMEGLSQVGVGTELSVYGTRQRAHHLRTLTGHTGCGRNSVSFSPDGGTLASGGMGTLLSVSGTRQRAPIDAPSPGIRVGSIAYHSVPMEALSQVGVRTRLSVSGTRQRAPIYAPSPGIRVWVRSVSFSPDGGTIASGSYDATIRLWDAATGDHRRTLTGHTDWVRSISFSPDGGTLASGSRDGTVLLWELIPSADVNATVSVSPASVPSPAIGEPLTLSINIAGGEKVAGYQATVEFDSSALRYVESANGDFLPAGAFFVTPVVSGNRVTLAATSLAGESRGDGTLATVSFEVVAVKASSVSLADMVLSDSAGAGLRPEVENGQVVEPPQVTGDVNQDGVVNILDLVLVAGQLGQTGQNDADVNGDGIVNIQDLVLVAGALGQAAAAPALPPGIFAPLTATDVERWLTEAQNLDLTDAQSKRGILFLERLLIALTPKETVLLPNYPNPFNPETWIPYHLASAADVQVTIYDTKGTIVRQLDLGHQPAGYYTDRAKAAYWDGRNASGESVASGVYVYKLRAGSYHALRRMVIVK